MYIWWRIEAWSSNDTLGGTHSCSSSVTIMSIIIATVISLSFLSTGHGSRDYDFPAAEEMLAISRRTDQGWSRPRQSPRVSGLPSPDSAIGYDVECGLRNGRFGPLTGNPGSENYAFGGQVAIPGEFPWQVSIQLRTGWISLHICSGAVISSHWVITGGHCVANLKPKGLTIVAGEHDLFRHDGTEQRVNVVRIVNGGYQEGENFAGDIALLQIDPPLELGPQVSPICLPQSTRKYDTGNATISGWGKLSEKGDLPQILHYISMPIISLRHCQEIYENAGYGRFINKACQICGVYDKGFSGSCQGDSGSPVVCLHEDRRYYLCGIVSWGVGCARPRLPGVFTETTCYIDWIKNLLYNVNGLLARLPAYAVD